MSKIRELYDRVLALFAPFLSRSIKEVDSWDGSASNYTDTEQYCRACLINVNAEAGNSAPEDWTQDHCMLPVREPGDGGDVYVKQAVYAAAGGHGITQVTRPDDVSADDWEAAVTAAARRLISAYNQMDETAPGSVYEMAGETPPETRATSMSQVYDQIMGYTYREWPEMWLQDLYTDDDGSVYAIAVSEGHLYRSEVSLVGGEVTMTDWQRIEVQHVPVMRGLTIHRQADGRYRWAGIACTAVLNKDGEIDSTSLFDSFVGRFTERASDANVPLPTLDFYHEPSLALGTVDYLARDEYALVASGLFDDTPLGRAVATGLQTDPGYWGMSITYRPSEPAGMADVGGVSIPVWTSGVLESIAVLPVNRASAWFTTIKTRSGDMKQEILDALKRLVGDEQALVLAGQVDETNDRVTGEGMIARATEVETETPEDQETETPEDQETGEVPPDVQVVVNLRQQLQEQEQLLLTIVQAVEGIPDLVSRVEVLEQSEDQRRRAYLSDLPATPARIVVRPRETHREAGDEQEPDTNDLVAQRLAAKGVSPAA